MEALLARGIVPVELTGERVETFVALLDRFSQTSLSQSDVELLPTLRSRIGEVRVERLTYSWVEEWVGEMQRGGLSPSTLTKRVGLTARCIDWAMRREFVSCATNPLRLLPRGYATRGRVAKEKVWSGERDRRVSTAEEGAIRTVLAEKGGHTEEMVDVAREARAHGERDSIVEVLLKDIDLVLYPQAQQVGGIKLDLLVS